MNEEEPQHAALAAECPVELRERPKARAEWERIVGDLTSTGHITTVDRGTLLAYCLKYGQWLELEAQAEAATGTLTTRGGNLKANPTIALANAALSLVLKAAAELGLTPTSRSRVHATKPPEVDEFARYAAARPVPGLALVAKK